MFGPTDFSFVYDSIKFIADNTNSLEYSKRKVPNIPWLSQELSDAEDAAYIVTFSHVPPFRELEFFFSIVKLLSSATETVVFPYS